jgi:hypothetical protein
MAAASAATRELRLAEAAGDVCGPGPRPALEALERQIAGLVRAFGGGGGGGGGGDGGDGGDGEGAATGVGSAAAAAAGVDQGARAAPAPAASMGSSAALSSTRPRGADAFAAPAGACPCDPAASHDAPGLLGYSVSTFLREVVAGRALVGTKAEWVQYWRQRVMQLALLAHQYRNGAVGRDALEKVRLGVGRGWEGVGVGWEVAISGCAKGGVEGGRRLLYLTSQFNPPTHPPNQPTNQPTNQPISILSDAVRDGRQVWGPVPVRQLRARGDRTALPRSLRCLWLGLACVFEGYVRHTTGLITHTTHPHT